MIRWIYLLLIPIHLSSQTITLSPIGNQDVSDIPIQVEHYVTTTTGIMDVRIFRTHYGNGNTSQYQVYPSTRSEMDRLFNSAYAATTLWWMGTLNATTALNFRNYSTLTNAGASVPSNGDYYATEVTCTFVPKETGTYWFRMTSDDGSDLQIGSTSVIEYYGGKGIGSYKYGSIYLVKGTQYYFKARMQEFGGGDGLIVQWKRPSAGNYYLLTSEIGVTSSSWIIQGTKNTNSSGQVTFTNSSNLPFRVTIDVSSKFHNLNDDDMNYLMYKKANLSPITDWDFYTCDINNSTTFSWDDIYFGYTLWSQGHLHNKYVFTQSEKTTIESNPTTNYYNIYFPNQIRTIDNQSQFYIMGTGKPKTTISSNTIQ
jgi:hypothetical protein